MLRVLLTTSVNNLITGGNAVLVITSDGSIIIIEPSLVITKLLRLKVKGSACAPLYHVFFSSILSSRKGLGLLKF